MRHDTAVLLALAMTAAPAAKARHSRCTAYRPAVIRDLHQACTAEIMLYRPISAQKAVPGGRSLR